MKASEVYREAAKQMEDQIGYGYETEYSCCAVGFVAGGKTGYYSDYKLAQEYASRFAETPSALQQLIMEYVGPKERLNVRILGLCFMAAIAEDEERSRKRRS